MMVPTTCCLLLLLLLGSKEHATALIAVALPCPVRSTSTPMRLLLGRRVDLGSVKKTGSNHFSTRASWWTVNFTKNHKKAFSPTRILERTNSSYNDEVGDDNDISVPSFVLTDPVLKEAVKMLRRASWFSWWSQVILTTISSVILVFARSVIKSPADAPNFVLSGAGILLSTFSIVWTWGNGARLSRRLALRPTSRFRAAHMLRRAIRVGVTINLLGLLCNLLAAENIIGSLAIKVLTVNRNSLFAGGGAALLTEGLQPLDVLVVQANTNSLLAQFCSMASLLFLVQNVEKLDPPSTDDVPRKR